MDCEFSEPVEISAGSSTGVVFSKLICADQTELIQNTTTGAEFYIKKEITYGDVVLVWFLVLLVFFGLLSGIFNFIWRKR